jgi:hypothetical protein
MPHSRAPELYHEEIHSQRVIRVIEGPEQDAHAEFDASIRQSGVSAIR